MVTFCLEAGWLGWAGWYGIHGPDSRIVVILTISVNKSAFQGTRGDAMRCLRTRGDAMRFPNANHTGRCDAMYFSKDTGRCDAMQFGKFKARDDAMRWNLENKKHGAMRCDEKTHGGRCMAIDLGIVDAMELSNARCSGSVAYFLPPTSDCVCSGGFLMAHLGF